MKDTDIASNRQQEQKQQRWQLTLQSCWLVVFIIF